ncbi:hypothetical protein [Streptosporangium minutum]|uniref:Uncharacterized protein n=1 Tax=Streptosporangium minutum TaxID=569862 RepID=A0A243RUA9_9ACTN|nr:hypothetical protein [Streptosporangium minutum]OUC98757.1 hypothetical protein CA984_05770 [Streptosporangium minutum]
MTMLTYTLLTDPAPLEASAAGRPPSTGTVYLVVTNTGQQAAFWSTITVRVPVGNGAGDLTSDFGKIKPKGEYGTWSGALSSVSVQPGPQGSNAFQVTAPGGRASFAPGDHMVLTLEEVTVAPAAGLAVLKVTENTGRTRTGRLSSSVAAVPLVKTAAKEIPPPCDFRPDKVMLDGTDTLTLSWEGSDDFSYEILFPGGQRSITSNARSWSPAAADAPKRATTYILVATSRSTPQRKHYLTTTVQVRNPVLEALTATTGIDTPWVQGATDATKGRVIFTGTGVEISNNSGGQSTVTADKADLTGVNTGWVQGRSADDGWISFPKDGLNVYRDGTRSWGNVAAEKADLNGVSTKWVQGKGDRDGWIDFSYYGVNVFRHDEGTKRWGVLGVNRIDHH